MKCHNRRFNLISGIMFFGVSNSMIERLIAVALSVALLLFQTGCTVDPLSYQLPSPLSEAERTRLGSIGIVSADFIPETELFAHSRGRVSGAAKESAFEPGTAPTMGVPIPSGGFSIPGVSGTTGAGYAAVGLLALLAVGFVVGEGYRVITAVPAEKVKDAESNLKRALIELKTQESLKERFCQTAREQSAVNLVLIEKGGPRTADEKLNYGRLKEKGIDTVIELSVLSISFEGKGGKDPLLSLLVDVRTRLLSVSDGAVLYENKLEYRSARKKFTEWISANGKLLIDELDRGYGILSEKIVEELFLRYDVTPKKVSGKKAENVVREKEYA